MNRKPGVWISLLCSLVIVMSCSSGGGDGAQGPVGSAGPTGCTGLAANETPGLFASVTLQAPANGQFFTVGERAKAKLVFSTRCQNPVPVADLGTANLYLTGPRQTSLTKSASKLMNSIVDRAAVDRQHHFINLRSPKFLDTAQSNFSTASDGTVTFTFSPVTNEAAGTYMLGLWGVSKDGKDQVFKLTELQIGTAVREEFASGPTATSTCFDCHAIPGSDKASMNHIHPILGAASGNWALDQYPVATCQACHNLDGFSVNTTVRKVHGLHRGRNQLNAGAAHTEYSMPTDMTLTDYTNVDFPAMPMGERDCTTCHADDRWMTRPSRLACGTCHDNVFFDTGLLTPPSILGRPSGAACTDNASCSPLSAAAACNVGTGNCELVSHPTQSNDSACTSCHSEGASLPVSASHEIYQQTRVRGLQLTQVTLSGATGGGGAFLVGDTPAVSFKLATGSGTVVSDLITNAALSGTVIVAGPTDDRQRVYQLTIKTSGTRTYDSGTQKYTYTFPAPWPANALPPSNTTLAPRVNPAGTYTLWLYVNETFATPTSFLDSANAVVDFRFGSNGTVQPRQVVLKQACNACHTKVQAHGGSRQDEGGACSMCHTQGAEDRNVGSTGRSCAVDADCGLFASGAEACVSNVCTIVVDPTPGQSIDMAVMGHQIHFARLLGGYSTRNFLVTPGTLQYLGFNNTLTDMSANLLSVDVRNCTTCHTDSGASCTATTQCGIGQECLQGKCANRSWTRPSSRACLSCHDTAAAFGHAQLNTYLGLETCDVCHGTSSQSSVEKVHSTLDPYTPPYQRQ